jgi:hypothetical protein
MIAVTRDAVDRAFWLEGFRDYLSLEAGHSGNTVTPTCGTCAEWESLRWRAERASPVRSPALISADFVYLLKDLGLQRRDDPAQRVRHPDLLRLSGRRRTGAE